MSYRPIGDIWYCVRPKLRDGHKYYGAYPAGYLEKARIFMGVHISDAVLHVCSGMTRYYPYPKRAVGPNDKMLDLNPAVKPDFLQDARDPYPKGFKAIMCDSPYSEADAEHYPPGASKYPTPRTLLKNSLEALDVGRRVGILHYVAPRIPPGCEAKLIVEVDIKLGFENRPRVFSVYEKL